MSDTTPPKSNPGQAVTIYVDGAEVSNSNPFPTSGGGGGGGVNAATESMPVQGDLVNPTVFTLTPAHAAKAITDAYILDTVTGQLFAAGGGGSLAVIDRADAALINSTGSNAPTYLNSANDLELDIPGGFFTTPNFKMVWIYVY